MTIDPEFRALIPPLSAEELVQLEANIVRDGCRDPLAIWQGILVDGHNRLEICNRLSLPFRTSEIELSDRLHAKLWIIDNQDGRRNIKPIDRIKLQTTREGIITKLAEESYKANVGRPSNAEKESLPILAPISHVDTREECAKAAGVSHGTYAAAKTVLAAVEEGELPVQVLDEIRQGGKTINGVAKALKEAEEKKERDAEREAASKDVMNTGIIIGDFREKAEMIPNGSVALIFTDPPYDRKAAGMFGDLGKFASDKLCDGGSLICYIGHIQLREAIEALPNHLRYWWICACVHSGQNALMKEYGIRVGWKPMLWFVKGKRHDKSEIVFDTVSGGKEKSHHEWQQSEEEARYWIEKLCPENGIVCDPFLGGGTTAVASNALGRKWIGFEIDEDTAIKTNKRLQG